MIDLIVGKILYGKVTLGPVQTVSVLHMKPVILAISLDCPTL
jgi:hypothetical protein